MSHFKSLLRWAREQGVTLHGIEPRRIPGRGVGVVATRKIKAGEDILGASHEALRGLLSVTSSVREKLPPDTPIHCLLAADIALEGLDVQALWKAVLPSLADFEAGMPLMWPNELQDLLPVELKSNLGKQLARFSSQWEAFTKVFPDVPKQQFLYPWLVVNTRSFYQEIPETLKYPWDDRLALIPVADLFNHADVGCKVAYSAKEYTVTADRAYDKDEEIFISYGDHDNGYILLEYGFVSDDNRWDEIYVDDVILPKLSDSQKQVLESRDLLGRYPLLSSSEDFQRTQGVLRLLSCTVHEFEDFVAGKEELDETLQPRVDTFFAGLLKEFLPRIETRLREIQESQAGQEAQRNLLAKRWRQIEHAVRQTAKDYEQHQVNGRS